MLTLIDLNFHLMMSDLENNHILNNHDLDYAKNIEQETIAAIMIVRKTKLLIRRIGILNTQA